MKKFAGNFRVSLEQSLVSRLGKSMRKCVSEEEVFTMTIFVCVSALMWIFENSSNASGRKVSATENRIWEKRLDC